MRDEERIHLYYNTGLLDWRNEQQAEIIKKKENPYAKKSFFSLLTYLAIKRHFGVIIKKS